MKREDKTLTVIKNHVKEAYQLGLNERYSEVKKLKEKVAKLEQEIQQVNRLLEIEREMREVAV